MTDIGTELRALAFTLEKQGNVRGPDGYWWAGNLFGWIPRHHPFVVTMHALADQLNGVRGE